MISIDVSVFIQIVNFLLLIWVLNIILYKPIRKILIQRKEKVNGLEQNISSFGKQAEEKDEAFDAGIRAARANGLKEKEALIQAASEEEKQLVEKINQEAQAQLAEIRAKISRDAEKVRATLQTEIDSFANAIGQKILGRAVQ